jgi:hypothetical protein
MKASQVSLAAALAATLVLGSPEGAPASALDGRTSLMAFTEEPTATTTEAPSSGLTPAVEAPPEEEEGEEQPWTARFLAPLVLVLGLAALIGAIAYYGVRIRRRYRVIS